MFIQSFKSFKISIGLGLAALGRPEYINIREIPDDNSFQSVETLKNRAFAVMDSAYALGLRYFDAAASYGKAEMFLAEWIKSRKISDITVGSKWGYTYVAQWQKGAAAHEIKEHSLTKLNEQWQTAHKRFATLLGLYQIHSATFQSQVLENNAVLQRLHHLKKQNGLLIGLTASGPQQTEIIEAALKIRFSDGDLFDSFQVTYNILEQRTEAVLQEALKRNKIIIVKEALANGRIFKNSNFPQYQNLYKKLQFLSEKYEVGTDAVGLRFCLQSVNPQIVLSGASDTHQLKENIKAIDFTLTADEMLSLKKEKVSSEDYWSERNALVWN